MAYKRISPAPIVEGGTGAQTLTTHGVLLGAGTSAINPLAAASTGETLMGATGADPAFTGSPSFSGTVTAGTGLSVTTGNLNIAAGNLLFASASSADGQLIIGSTAGNDSWANLLGGNGIRTSIGSNILSVAAVGGGLAWASVVTATQLMDISWGYIAADSTSVVTFTLPAVADLGDVIRVVGDKVNGLGWTIAQNAGQYIVIGASTTTTGVGGSLASTVNSDCVELVCTTSGASTGWVVASSMGNITVV